MTKIAINQRAITFKQEDYLGNEIDLSNHKGKKILLSFFRGASCPFCNLRINQLIKSYSEFEKRNMVIIAFIAAPKEAILSYAGKQEAPFAIIPDPWLDIYKLYGIESSHSGMFKAMAKPIKMFHVMTSGFFNLKSVTDRPLIPADFLIDENQSIYRAYYGDDFGDHIPIEEILEWRM